MSTTNTVRVMVGSEVQTLPRPVLRTLWDWLDRVGEVPADSARYCVDDVSAYIVREVYRIGRGMEHLPDPSTPGAQMTAIGES